MPSTTHISSDMLPHQPYYHTRPQSNLAGMLYSKPRPGEMAPAPDFELFGPEQTESIPVGPPTSQRSNAYLGSTTSASDLPPVPDLIPDSPTSFSPPNPYPPPFSQHPFAMRASAGQQLAAAAARNERSASVPPLGEPPKPRRRRTQDWSDQESFVSSVFGNQPTPPQTVFQQQQQQQQHQHQQHQQRAAFAAAASPYSVSGISQFGPSPTLASGSTVSTGIGSLWAPSVDHPLSLPEQQDLLDRVRRDLNGVDLDSIKGPLRALALSGNDRPLSTAPSTMMGINGQQASRLVSKPLDNARDDLARRTVSPQEAFLDYEDVDNRLHANPRLGNNISSSFGLGVGSSLFAPLPRPSPVQRPTSTPVPIPNANTSPRASSPTAASLPSTPPRHAVTGAALFPRRPHPFAVPQNAVSWAERQASFDDSTGGAEDYERESSDGDEESDSVAVSATADTGAIVGATSGKKPVMSSAVAELFDDDDGAPSGDDDKASAATHDDEVTGQFDEDQHLTRARSRTPSSAATANRSSRANRIRSPAPSSSHAHSSTPARPSQLGISSAVAPPSPPASEPTEAEPVVPVKTSHTMRGSAVRALQALQQDDDLEELGDDADADAATAPEDDDDEPFEPRTSARRSTPSQRKRSRTPATLDGDDEDEYGSVGEASFYDSDDSDSAAKRSNAGGAPNKRRRRIPTAAATTATSTSSLRCTHSNPDGSICGVVFRRPYDLARHRETIHGEGGKAGKKHDWICKQCGGSFSRKDALIRHGRIRNHKAGV